MYPDPINKANSYSFFSLNPVYLSGYMIPDNNSKDTLSEYMKAIGGIAVYVLKDDIKLMDFSNVSTIQFMKKILKDKNAPSHVIDAFESSWRVDEDKNTLSRISYESEDLTFINWLCSKGYGGYLGMDVEGLHDEIALCFPGSESESVIEYKGTIDYEFINFPLFEKPYVSYPDLNVYYTMPTKSQKEFEEKEDRD